MVMDNRSRLDLASFDAVKNWLRDLLVDIIGVHVTEDSKDFFKSGVDLLYVIRMAREVKFQAKRQGLGAGLEMFSPKDIYAHPTLNDLASRILKCAGPPHHLPGRSQELDTDPAAQSSDNDAQLLLNKYTKKLPTSSSRASRVPPERNITVLLTGSTGSLGSYILDALYRDKNVARVICLNRSSSAEERHLQNSVQRGLTSISGARVNFIKADLSLPRMGIEDIQYSQLLNIVTHIIRKYPGGPHLS